MHRMITMHTFPDGLSDGHTDECQQQRDDSNERIAR